MTECKICRLCDFVLASTAILVLSPFSIPLIVLLRLSGEGNIFFKQERLGRGGRPFLLLKFATMLKDSPQMPGGNITSKNDPRILPLGRLLRSTKINELPQLINIARGDMSFIGPRPLTKDNFIKYKKKQQEVIGKLRPGLSGVGSLIFSDEESWLAGSGREETYSQIIVPLKSSAELHFSAKQSFKLYCVLILATFIIVLVPAFKDSLLKLILPTFLNERYQIGKSKVFGKSGLGNTKIIDLNNSADIQQIRKSLDADGRLVGLCHGCFDLIHPGHIHHFEEARQWCDFLVVSITADRFIKKGSGRPILEQHHRAEVLAELGVVDLVYIVDEESAVSAIKDVRPDYYFKGIDYQDNLEGEKVDRRLVDEKIAVEDEGGSLVFTRSEKLSSTDILTRFLKSESVH
ncbi:sugar transferase [Litorivicinus sp.]|nr:sugar transferase [Litorivicinus sp.]